jgi:FkbM family methyltransferase
LDKVRAMKKWLKVVYTIYLKFLSSALFSFVKLIQVLPRGRRVSTLFLEQVWEQTEKVETSNGEIYFAAPDWLSKYRADSFYQKEPETIAFLNTLTKDSILWDVGANIGIYSVYAGKVTGARVYAFEPSMMNLELLFRNVQENNLGNRVTIIPLALSNKDSVLDLFMSKEDLHWAGAHNSIGQNTSQDGQAMTDPKVSSQLSATGANLITAFNVPAPTHIKIDVDGLESLVIEGLQSNIEKIDFILVEIDARNMAENSSISSLLKSRNFSRVMDFAGHKYTENQLWKNERDLG